MATIKITVRQKRIVHEDAISLTSFGGEVRDIVDDESDPETLLIRKVEGLAALLGCSEQHAQRLIFERCELPS